MNTKKADIASPEFDDVERIINSNHIRNLKIRSFWEGMKVSKQLTFRERRQIVVDKWHISPELVNKIISRNC